ncbi:polysaccharide biosynthesis protein [Lactobacillus sp. CBA3606]|uniref:polysaccharide biosynthesis protein n=1 Tax=Lactobacillus sp. CBA3606 TaxID=2099789 RepID=UPI000CFACA73|nr:polysaccharide biosynthesis protein [Lactobacillus sp. CBA3606]AVK62729.1 polysaccharide biosynthesis protein [Lactobacillus sp. CBA3606]
MLVYKPKARLRLAWKWLPIELFVLLLSLGSGWLVNQTVAKPVYTARVDISIQQTTTKRQTQQQRQKMHRQDIKNVTQFNVMPRQPDVLYTASEYAYMRFGIWQPVGDLSESVQAVARHQQPVLRLSVSSTSKPIAQQNAAAFDYAVTKSLRHLKRYRIRSTTRAVIFEPNRISGSVYKFSLIVGLILALLVPYVSAYLTGEKGGWHAKNKKTSR